MMRQFTEAERAAIGELWAVAAVCAQSDSDAMQAFAPMVLARIQQIVTASVTPLMPDAAQVEVIAQAAIDCTPALELLEHLNREKRH